MTFSALGDSAVVVAVGVGADVAALPRVRALVGALERDRPPGIVDIVAAYATVAVFYDPAAVPGSSEKTPYERVCHLIAERGKRLAADAKQKSATTARTVEIPICYGGEYGLDLEEVAAHSGLSPEEVAKQHAAGDYLVQAIGFSPGFPYLGGLPAKLAMPRRPTPRVRVPAGSVGIGGSQTGIYPLSTPGGWRLIGRTPLALFRPGEAEPALLRVGDRVKFRALSAKEFAAWK